VRPESGGRRPRGPPRPGGSLPARLLSESAQRPCHSCGSRNPGAWRGCVSQEVDSRLRGNDNAGRGRMRGYRRGCARDSVLLPGPSPRSRTRHRIPAAPCMTVLAAPGAGRFRQIRAVRFFAWGIPAGRGHPRILQRFRHEAQHGPDPTRSPATSVGVPLADWGDGEGDPLPIISVGGPGACEDPSLVLDGRFPLRVRPAPALPAGISKAPNARREGDRATVLTQERPCTSWAAAEAPGQEAQKTFA